jgi:signal transduction histidine kinase
MEPQTERSDFPPLGSLITSRASVPPNARVNEAVEVFFRETTLDAMGVVEGDAPRGLLTRQKLLSKLFMRYGFELHGKKTVMELADTTPLILPSQERLDSALDYAMARGPAEIYDDIVVVDDGGRFEGLLAVKQMVLQQTQSLANILVQKELAGSRARELEAMDRVRSQFIANVTHELRSPVNAIVELAEIVRISSEKGYIGQVQDRLALLLSSATNLRSIITNILDLSKMEAGKMEVILETFDLAALLREVGETTKVLLGNKPVAVEIAPHLSPLPFRSDPVKVRQVLINLASNATKFTEHGRIVLSTRDEGDQLAVAVKDTGIGIRQEDLHKLFVAFSQIEDVHTKRHEGTGLGLTITRQLTELLGGRITLSSHLGEGAEFTVVLPKIEEGNQDEKDPDR